jgi:hypothetical protein
LTVIRGINDNFICDHEAAAFLYSKNIKVIEANGGHNWCEEIEKTVHERIAASINRNPLLVLPETKR